uniref:Uncharacterized protein n=1 Tax=Oryza nivara TaxID=4536 RepID=A0A0E0IRS9_ORYNI
MVRRCASSPLRAVGCLPRRPGLGGCSASVAGQPGCRRGGQVWCGSRTTGAPASGADLERQRHRRLDGSAKGAGGGGLSSSLPVGIHPVPGSPSAKTGEVAGGW